MATDSRWDDDTAELVARTREGHDTETIKREGGKWDYECRDCDALTEGGRFARHIEAVDAGLRHNDAMVLAALADHGLLVTPEKAAVLDAAREAVEHLEEKPHWAADLVIIEAWDDERDELEAALAAAVEALPDRTEEGR